MRKTEGAFTLSEHSNYKQTLRNVANPWCFVIYKLPDVSETYLTDLKKQLQSNKMVILLKLCCTLSLNIFQKAYAFSHYVKEFVEKIINGTTQAQSDIEFLR